MIRSRFVSMKKIITITLAFILMMSFVTSAVVSDNDGSAFITKAEFDSLKNNFQTQLDAYNTGIDSKIDQAISAYLSGISLSKDPTNLWTKVEDATGKNIWWQNSIAEGDENLTPYVALSVTREIYTESVQAGRYGWWYGSKTAAGNGYALRHYVNATSAGGTDLVNFDATNFPNTNSRTDYYTGSWTEDSRGWDKVVKRKNTYYNTNSSTSNGSGTRWEMHINGAGKAILRNYYTSYFPILLFTVWDHKFNDLFTQKANVKKGLFEDGGRGYATSGSGTAPTLTKWGTKTSGTKVTGQNTGSGNYIELKGMLNAVSDTVDYSYRMFAGGAATSAVYVSRDDADPYELTAATNKHTLTVEESTFYDMFHQYNMEKVQTNKIAKYDMTYYDYNVDYNYLSTGAFYNEYVSQATGEETYVTEGCKIATANSDGKYKISIKFKTNTGSGNVVYCLSDQKFNRADGGISAGATNIKDGTVASGTEVVANNVNLNKDDAVWVNLYAATSGNLATIESFEIKYLGE